MLRTLNRKKRGLNERLQCKHSETPSSDCQGASTRVGRSFLVVGGETGGSIDTCNLSASVVSGTGLGSTTSEGNGSETAAGALVPAEAAGSTTSGSFEAISAVGGGSRLSDDISRRVLVSIHPLRQV